MRYIHGWELKHSVQWNARENNFSGQVKSWKQAGKARGLLGPYQPNIYSLHHFGCNAGLNKMHRSNLPRLPQQFYKTCNFCHLEAQTQLAHGNSITSLFSKYIDKSPCGWGYSHAQANLWGNLKLHGPQQVNASTFPNVFRVKKCQSFQWHPHTINISKMKHRNEKNKKTYFHSVGNWGKNCTFFKIRLDRWRQKVLIIYK